MIDALDDLEEDDELEEGASVSPRILIPGVWRCFFVCFSWHFFGIPLGFNLLGVCCGVFLGGVRLSLWLWCLGWFLIVLFDLALGWLFAGASEFRLISRKEK